MTRLELVRSGVPALIPRGSIDWRQWAYEDVKRQGCSPLTDKVWIEVTPTCKDVRSRQFPTVWWPVMQQCVDALISAEVLPSWDIVHGITVHRARATGNLSLTFVATDSSEPF
jgi:hypothetical protein